MMIDPPNEWIELLGDGDSRCGVLSSASKSGVLSSDYALLTESGLDPFKMAGIELLRAAKRTERAYAVEYARFASAIFTRLTGVWRWRFDNCAYAGADRGDIPGIHGALYVPPFAAVWYLRGSGQAYWGQCYIEGNISSVDKDGCDLVMGASEAVRVQMASAISDKEPWPTGALPLVGPGSVCAELSSIADVDQPANLDPATLIEWTVRVVDKLHTRASIVAAVTE